MSEKVSRRDVLKAGGGLLTAGVAGAKGASQNEDVDSNAYMPHKNESNTTDTTETSETTTSAPEEGLEKVLSDLEYLKGEFRKDQSTNIDGQSLPTLYGPDRV